MSHGNVPQAVVVLLPFSSSCSSFSGGRISCGSKSEFGQRMEEAVRVGRSHKRGQHSSLSQPFLQNIAEGDHQRHHGTAVPSIVVSFLMIIQLIRHKGLLCSPTYRGW